jgi:hypothetical protein
MKKDFFLATAILAMFTGMRPFMFELLAVLRSAILRPSPEIISLPCSHCREALQAEAIT